MEMKEFQILVKVMHERKGYNIDGNPLMLALGVCEEAGELAKAVNVHHNPLYKPKLAASQYDSVEHELVDLMVYIAGMANSLHINLDDLLNEKASSICEEYNLVVI